jgi:enoyl-CoA hydratase/carnithine racemase
VADGLVAESALYSALQAGPEHRAWRAATPVAHRPGADGDDDDSGERVRVERVGDQLRIALARPERRNALDVAMRDQLLAALAIAEADPDLHVVLGGDGPSFCAGGDLDEFGTAPDPATAHLVRLRRSVGAALHRLATRTTVHVHGANAGSGVELAAFAGRVVAGPDATFVLPELAMGLVPGAGGTVSLPRRIGRHRTAWLALTGRPVDAATARAWGLVDAVDLI